MEITTCCFLRTVCLLIFVWLISLTNVTVDKTIKLWKICAKSFYESRAVNSYRNDKQILFPIIRSDQSQRFEECDEKLLSEKVEYLQAVNKRTFANAHAYHINSLSVNNDQESFISSDDLRINLWKLENCDVTFSKYFFFVAMILLQS